MDTYFTTLLSVSPSRVLKWIGVSTLATCLGMALSCPAQASPAKPHQTRQQQARELNNLGTALVNQQLLQPASEKFAQAYRLDPQMTTALTNQGIALYYLGKAAQAEPLLLHSAKQNPRDPYTWYVLGLLYQSRGESAKAAGAFKHVLTIAPNDPDTLYSLGSSEVRLHHLDLAIADFNKALKQNPLHASAEYGLATALRMSGKVPQAMVHFRRFQQLLHDKVTAPLSHNYGEEGKYSTTQSILPSGPVVGPMIPITFTRQNSSAPAAPSAKSSLSSQPGGGACLIRPQANGPLYLIVPTTGTQAIQAYRFTVSGHGAGHMESVSAAAMGLKASGHGLSCAVGDYDNDGLPDLAVAFSNRVELFHNLGHGKFANVTKQVGIHALNRPTGVTFVDYDHDGDLDLYVTGRALTAKSSPNIMWRNNGNKTFTNITSPKGLGNTSSSTTAILSDVNNDRAVDLIVAGSGAAPTLFINRREGPFASRPLYQAKGLPATEGVAVFDYNKDGWMDVALTHAGAPGVTLWRNVDGKSFQRVPLPIHDATRAWGITPVDIDNDGWIDLAVIIDTAHGPQLRVLRNMGPKGFQDVTDQLGLNKIKLHNPRSVIAADLYGNGAPDLIVTQLHRPPVVLINHGGNRNHSLTIYLRGLADNKMAIGTKVEVFSNDNWQKFEVTGSSGYLSQGPDTIVAGLGQQTHANIVRLLWPTGVPQDEIKLQGKSVDHIAELDRRGSSCPTLFTWDGHQYKFISDVIGAAVVGHWVAPHKVNTPDPAEWIKIPGRDLQPRNGYLSLRFGEPMEEVNYLDQVRLVAVDHPAGTHVYPNERFLSEPPFPRTQVILTSGTHPVAAAWGNHGHNVTAILRNRDNQYLEDFTNLPYDGFAKMHALTLDLGHWTAKNPLHLLLSGYVDYFSASSMYSAWQAGLKPIPPYIEAQLPNGKWKRVVNDMGFPAGLPRTIVVNLTGKLPPGTRRIRIKTNLQIYWNQILVDNAPNHPGDIRQTRLPLSSARLAFRGYPQQIALKAPGLITYNYNSNSQTGPFSHAQGYYTRYGAVTPLLQHIDNQFVVFGTGEDLDLEFPISALPPLPRGWKRDYFFYANGYVKDMDFHEIRPFTVGPMPYHGMASYPPRKPMPPAMRNAFRDYELKWNTRYEPLGNTHPYRFHYVGRNMHPPANPLASPPKQRLASNIGAASSTPSAK